MAAGDPAALGDTQKLQEARAIQQLLLDRVVCQIVALLQHQYPGHEDDGIRQTATLGTRRARQGRIDFIGQRTEIDVLDQSDKGIGQLRASATASFLAKQVAIASLQRDFHAWSRDIFRTQSKPDWHRASWRRNRCA